MTATAADTAAAAQRRFVDELVAHGLLVPSGVPGVFGRAHEFENVIERFERHVSSAGSSDGAEIFRFPPLINRAHFVQSEYLKSFPDLAGCVHSFVGGDAEHAELLGAVEHGNDWGKLLAQTDVVFTPAACYPLYPMIAGTLPSGGRLFDVYSYCFRHEPSPDPARMQVFRQREYVRVGDAAACAKFRDLWHERGMAIMDAVELPAKSVVANDPFFGRRGRMLAADQRDQALKFELVVPITSTEKPTACVSLNYHQDHFGRAFRIKTPDGADAHTACIGFGVERVALALFRTHGLSTANWPAGVRRTLGL
jgi:seryl-tRNA synthetase